MFSNLPDTAGDYSALNIVGPQIMNDFQSSWRLCSSLSSWTAPARRSWWTWRNKGTCYLFIGQTNFNTLLRKWVQFKQKQLYTGWTHLCLVLWHGDLLEPQGQWWSLWTGEEKQPKVFACFSSVSKTMKLWTGMELKCREWRGGVLCHKTERGIDLNEKSTV